MPNMLVACSPFAISDLGLHHTSGSPVARAACGALRLHHTPSFRPYTIHLTRPCTLHHHSGTRQAALCGVCARQADADGGPQTRPVPV